jgi:hypothetical protein
MVIVWYNSFYDNRWDNWDNHTFGDTAGCESTRLRCINPEPPYDIQKSPIWYEMWIPKKSWNTNNILPGNQRESAKKLEEWTRVQDGELTKIVLGICVNFWCAVTEMDERWHIRHKDLDFGQRGDTKKHLWASKKQRSSCEKTNDGDLLRIF